MSPDERIRDLRRRALETGALEDAAAATEAFMRAGGRDPRVDPVDGDEPLARSAREWSWYMADAPAIIFAEASRVPHGRLGLVTFRIKGPDGTWWYPQPIRLTTWQRLARGARVVGIAGFLTST